MRLLLMIVLLFLTACAASDYQSQLNTYWQGKNANALIKRWGTPETQVVLPDGNTHLGYITNSYPNFSAPPAAPYTISAPHGEKPVIVRTPTDNTEGLSLLKCETSFEINKQQRIVRVNIDGNNCQQDPKFVTRLSNSTSN